MEPYPKSRVKELHQKEVEIEKESPGKVAFIPFIGISPYRYRDIFQKSRRKREDGTARRWYSIDDTAEPMVEIFVPNYFPEAEVTATSSLVGDLTQSVTSDGVSGTTNGSPTNDAN